MIKRIDEADLKLKEITSLVAHYGSVSVSTFMIAVTFLKGQGVCFESELYLFLVKFAEEFAF